MLVTLADKTQTICSRSRPKLPRCSFLHTMENAVTEAHCSAVTAYRQQTKRVRLVHVIHAYTQKTQNVDSTPRCCSLADNNKKKNVLEKHVTVLFVSVDSWKIL